MREIQSDNIPIQSAIGLQPEQVDIYTICATIAQACRDARLAIVHELVAPLYNPTCKRISLPSESEVSVRGTLLAVYKDGIEWLKSGIIPSLEERKDSSIDRRWLMRDPTSMPVLDMEAINRNIASYGAESSTYR